MQILKEDCKDLNQKIDFGQDYQTYMYKLYKSGDIIWLKVQSLKSKKGKGVNCEFVNGKKKCNKRQVNKFGVLRRKSTFIIQCVSFSCFLQSCFISNFGGRMIIPGL